MISEPGEPTHFHYIHKDGKTEVRDPNKRAMKIEVTQEELGYITQALECLYSEHYSYEVEEGDGRLEKGKRIMTLQGRLLNLKT